MKLKHIKLISLSLALIVALLFFACDKNDKDVESSIVTDEGRVSADAPWFESTRLEVDLGIDKNMPVEYVGTNVAGIDDKLIVLVTSGYYKLPDSYGSDSDMSNYDSYAIHMASVYDRVTNRTINTIDLRNLPVEGVIDTVTYSCGSFSVTSVKYDSTTNKTMSVLTHVDPLTGNILDTCKLDEEENVDLDRSFTVGKYRIDTFICWDSEIQYFTLRIHLPDGNKQEVVFAGDGNSIYGIPAILPITDTTALICAEAEHGVFYYTLNFENYTVVLADSKDYEWLNTNILSSVQTGTDGKLYYTSSNGVSRINMNKKSIETAFDYSWCGINRHTLNSFFLAEATGNSFILYGEKHQSGTFLTSSQPEFFIYEFSKTEKNPHSGKIILELYSAGGELDEAIADAVLKFNATNSDYYIVVTDKYSFAEYLNGNSNPNSQDEWEKYNLRVNAKMSDELAMDITNGKGPDILLNTSSYGVLNNPRFLANLTPYLETRDSDKYFTNVIAGAKYEGAIYQLPITFAIDGIHTNSKYAGITGVGFTTDEYEGFLKGALNGKDVIGAGQAIYFAKLFSTESELFIKNGKVDFTTSEFKELARFVKNNVPQNSRPVGDASGDSVIAARDGRCAIYSSCGSISTFLSDTDALSGASAILGIPSTDGRGPAFYPNCSVAVSAQSKSIEACVEFVRLLISDEIQSNFALRDNLVINREALRKASESAIDFYNNGATGVRKTYSEENIDDLEKAILSCSRMNSTDYEISIILVEEMPAYFMGQKDLDSVIIILEDKVQKVLDERE